MDLFGFITRLIVCNKKIIKKVIHMIFINKSK